MVMAVARKRLMHGQLTFQFYCKSRVQALLGDLVFQKCQPSSHCIESSFKLSVAFSISSEFLPPIAITLGRSWKVELSNFAQLCPILGICKSGPGWKVVEFLLMRKVLKPPSGSDGVVPPMTMYWLGLSMTAQAPSGGLGISDACCCHAASFITAVLSWICPLKESSASWCVNF